MRLNVAYTSDLLRLKKEDILEKINIRSQAKTIDSMLRKAYEIHGKSYHWDLVRSFDTREKDKGKSGKRGTKEKDVELMPVASRRDDWERIPAPPPPPVVKQPLPPTSDRFARHASSGGGVTGRLSGKREQPAVNTVPPGHLGAKNTPIPYSNTSATPAADNMGTLLHVLSQEDPKPKPPQVVPGSQHRMDDGASPNANFPQVRARATTQGAPGEFSSGKNGSSTTPVLSGTQSKPSLPTGHNGVNELNNAKSKGKLNQNPAIARGQTVEPSVSNTSNTRSTTPVSRLTPGYAPVAPSRIGKPLVRGPLAGYPEEATVPPTPNLEQFYRTTPQQPQHQQLRQQPLQTVLDLTGRYHDEKEALAMNELRDILKPVMKDKHDMAPPQTATPAPDELLARNHRGSPAMVKPIVAQNNLHAPFDPRTDYQTAYALTELHARNRGTQVAVDPLYAQQTIDSAESSPSPKTASSGHIPPREPVSTRFAVLAKNDADAPPAMPPQTDFRQDVPASPVVAAPSRYAPFGERRVSAAYNAGPGTSGDDLLELARNAREERLKSSQSLHTDVHATADHVVSVEPFSATWSPVVSILPTPSPPPAFAVDPQPMQAQVPQRAPVLSFRKPSKAIVPEERNSLVSDDEEDGTSATVRSSDYCAVAGESATLSNAVSGQKQASRSVRSKLDEADSDDEVAEESEVATAATPSRFPVVQPSLTSPSASGLSSATGLSDMAPSLMAAERGERLTAPEPMPEPMAVPSHQSNAMLVPEPTQVTPSIPVQQVLNIDAEVAAWIASEKLPSELVDSLPHNGVYTFQQVRDMTPEVLGLVTSGLKPLPVKRVQQTVDALRVGMTWEQHYRSRTPSSRSGKSPAIQRPPAVQHIITSPSDTFSATGLSDLPRLESTSSLTTEERSDRSSTLEPVPEPTPVRQPALVLDAEVVAWIANEKLPKELLNSLPANGVSTLQQVRDMTAEVLGLVTSGLKPLPVKRVQQTVDALRVGMTWEQHYRSRTPTQSIRTITSATTSSASSVSTVAPSLAPLPTPPRYVSPNATGRLGSTPTGAMRGPVSRGQSMQQLTSPHKAVASDEEVDWSYYRENRVLEEAEKSWSISELERAIHLETVVVYYLTDIQANDEEFYEERVLNKIRSVYVDDYEPESKKFISESALEKLVEIKSLHRDRAQRLQALLREKMETGEKDKPSVDDAEESHGPIQMDVQRSSDNKRVSFGGGVTRFTIDAKPCGLPYEVNEVFEISVEQAEEEKQLRREKRIRDEQRKQEEKLQKNAEEKRMVTSGEGWACFCCQTVNTNANDRCKLCKMPSPWLYERVLVRQPGGLKEEREGPVPEPKLVLSKQESTSVPDTISELLPNAGSALPEFLALTVDAQVAAWIASEKLPSELLDRLPAHRVYTLQQVRDMTPEVLGLVTSGLRPLPMKKVQQTVDALRLGMTWEQHYRARTPPSRASTSPANQRPPVVQPSLAYPSEGIQPALVLDAEVVAWIAREKLPNELLDRLPVHRVYTLQQVRDMTPEVLGLVTSGLRPLPVKRVQQTVDALKVGMTWEQYYRSITPTK
eukprot:gene24765-29926_t